MKNYLLTTLFFCFISSLIGQNFINKPIRTIQILFGTNASDIQHQYFNVLDSCVLLLTNDTLLRVQIRAHTDNVGSQTHNAKLSQARAEVIQNYFIQKGIDNQRFTTDWKGESEPVAHNQTEAGKMQNRRVTITVSQRIAVSTVTSVVKDDSGRAVVNALVRMHSHDFTDSTRTDSQGAFTMNVPFKKPVLLQVTAKEYFFDKQMLNLSVADAKLKPFMLIKAEIAKKIRIPDLNFYPNKAILLPESVPNVKIVVWFLRENPTFKVEIAGHINAPGRLVPVNSIDWNLSVMRARTIYEQLIESGIDSKRLVFKGYGSTEMLFPRAKTDEEEAANRRVEIRIIAK